MRAVRPSAAVPRRAGLGRATICRHFPDRTALALAVAAHRLAAFKNRVRGNESFRELLRAVPAMQARRRPLVRLCRELPERSRRQCTHALVSLLRPAFEEAQRDGSVRADLEPRIWCGCSSTAWLAPNV
ncbi:hypothetical protein OG738_30920 [Amycolatopsis sp. NBC_01488]|uniref:hypothetical protein n=1 Tax=Amycolatopsis sp. NBC_01488 TaxID=2903563 RepID=UPI002E27BCC9|nr:hypothetical protein [Amycolatopsis sp. NBC_01488]